MLIQTGLHKIPLKTIKEYTNGQCVCPSCLLKQYQIVQVTNVWDGCSSCNDMLVIGKGDSNRAEIHMTGGLKMLYIFSSGSLLVETDSVYAIKWAQEVTSPP